MERNLYYQQQQHQKTRKQRLCQMFSLRTQKTENAIVEEHRNFVPNKFLMDLTKLK